MDAYELAYEYVQGTNRCIFLTGKAGTGKTTFLRQLYSQTQKQITVVAPTGVAAINAEGVTIHSLFQLPPQLFIPTPEARKQLFSEIQIRKHKIEMLRRLELLVIDEISMVRADLLDTIDAILRHFRRRPNLPFGGVQVLFIGDLFQLSPVAREAEWQILRPYYEGPYFFQAHVLKEIQPVYIELDHVFRQQNQQFVEILNEVRNNILSATSRDLLNARYIPGYERQKDDIILSTHNQKVDDINAREMAQLTGKTYAFHAEIEGVFPESNYPMNEILELKQGARVMFTKNDTASERRFYNGKLGVVLSISPREVVVLSEGEEIDVPVAEWENIRYKAGKQEDSIVSEVIGTFKQLPLRLAWAITIHKSQGLTFDKVVIDAADAFAAGQVYVALSRCRTLEGIVLLSPIPQNALTNARDVLHFTESQASLEQVGANLGIAQLDYLGFLLASLYDFHPRRLEIEALRRITIGEAVFTEGTNEYIRSLWDIISAWIGVGERFQQQLHMLIRQQSPILQERLKAAYQYFHPQIKEVLVLLANNPAVTNNKDAAKDYSEQITELYQALHKQDYTMQQMAQEASIHNYFDSRKTYHAPSIKIAADGAPIKVKAKKGDSLKLTLDMLKSGMSCEQIADKRKLQLSTVCAHVADLIKTGVVPLKAMFTPREWEKAQMIQQAKHLTPELKKELLSAFLSEEQLFLLLQLRNYMG